MKEITRQWLEAAGDDLKVIAKIIPESGLSHMVAFHAQLSIEKTLKAYIEEHDIFLPKTHDLLRLRKLSSLNFSDEEIEIIETLNDLYINAWYPGETGLLPDGKPSITDCEKFEHSAFSSSLVPISFFHSYLTAGRFSF